MNFLDANPDDAERAAMWRQHGDFIPHLWRGRLAGVHWTVAERVIPTPLPAEQFITDMEILGFRFAVCEAAGRPALFREEPDYLPDAWDHHALRLLAAFHGQKLTAEAIEFLRKRDGAAK